MMVGGGSEEEKEAGKEGAYGGKEGEENSGEGRPDCEGVVSGGCKKSHL